MDATDIQKHIMEHAVPHLKEAGVEAFSLVAYVKDGDGNITKICLTESPNIVYQDGLRAITSLMANWAMTHGHPPGIAPYNGAQPL